MTQFHYVILSQATGQTLRTLAIKADFPNQADAQACRECKAGEEPVRFVDWP